MTQDSQATNSHMDEEIQRQFDALLKLAEFNIARFDERRNHSWKIALAFWAVIVGSAAILRSAKPPAPDLFIVIVGIVVILLHSYWLKKVFEADTKDKLLAFMARDEAIKILPGELEAPPLELKERSWRQDWSVRFQLATTLLLVSAIAIFVLI